MNATSLKPKSAALQKTPLARLPYELREQLCRRLRDRHPARAINAWLAAAGAGPYNAQNFTNFRKTHYKKWLAEQARLDAIRDRTDTIRRELDAGGYSVLDKAIYDLAQQISDSDLDPARAATAISALKTAVTAGERTRINSRRADLAAQALSIQRQKFEIQSCELFLKWFTDARAREIAQSQASNSEKIEALRKTYFADVDALDATGTIELPK